MSVKIIDCVCVIEELIEEIKIHEKMLGGTKEYKKGVIQGLKLAQDSIKAFNNEFVGD